MKKLSWSGLDFLRRDRGAHARELPPNTSQSQLGANRWNSESKLHGTDEVSHNIGINRDALSNKGRLSFSDLLRLKKTPSQPFYHEPIKAKSGLLDTLKRKFKLARSEHSRIRQLSKRHSFSLSISSITEEGSERETLPKSKTLQSVQSTCRLCTFPSGSRQGRETLCDIHSELDPLSENQDDHNDNVLTSEQVYFHSLFRNVDHTSHCCMNLICRLATT